MLTKIKINIPQTREIYFIIKRGGWNHSIDILITHDLTVNILNLYLIIKSYLLEEINLLHSIYLIGKNEIEKEEKLSIFYKISVKKLKKMNFKDFEDWFEDKYSEMYEYLKIMKYFGIRLCFFKEGLMWKTGEMYPIYPWIKTLEPFIDKNYDKNLDLINSLKKKIETLEEKLNKK